MKNTPQRNIIHIVLFSMFVGSDVELCSELVLFGCTRLQFSKHFQKRQEKVFDNFSLDHCINNEMAKQESF